MNPTVKARLSAQIQKLLDEGHAVLATKVKKDYQFMSEEWVDVPALNKWTIGCRSLVLKIGEPARAWIEEFSKPQHESYAAAANFFGKLQALKEAIDDDLLTRVEDLITADAFGSLLEQSNELFDKKFTLAAGVLGRAVLEEHLRKLCDRHQCLPTNRPTIGDLNQALYAGKHLDKLAMQQVTAMATAGNHCAHNVQPELSGADVRKFLDDVQGFLVRNPLP